MRPARYIAPLIVLLVAAALVLATLGTAAAVPASFSESIVASGLANPTAMALAPDGRIFVSEQGGTLRVIKNGVLLPTPFLTVTVSSAGERGLLGVAFDPAFASNQWVYVYYTATSPAIHNRVSRFTANGDVVTPGSEVVLLDLDNLSSATNHNGGSIHFGPDGKLYIAVGENATSSNSQTLANLLGKMLRINADGTIPTDNPFYNTASGVDRAIWALGLRNPFTFAFQPGSGRMFINDVGNSTWEEIDDGIAGSNYGWPNSEGPTSNAGERGPLYYYGHGTGAMLGCAITGGDFYDPAVTQFPAAYVGSYFFADYCGNWINRVDPANGFAVSTFATAIAAPIDLEVGSDGSLYYLARGTGTTTGVVGRIQYGVSPTPSPTATVHATPTPTPTPTGTPRPIVNTTFRFANAAQAVTSSAGDNNGYQSGSANLFSFNNVVATDASSGTGSSQSCTATNRDKENLSGYSFGLPGSAAIKGITVQIRGRVSSTSSTPKFCVLLSWNGGTSWTAGKLSSTLGTTLTTYTLGSMTDLWGRTWAAADFGANFRVRIVDLANSTSRTFYCDGVSVRVTYQ
ncbi:MAG: PQQ-dependent sugar dehydrogenase [Candidatus Limnocylindrales bacterium]